MIGSFAAEALAGRYSAREDERISWRAAGIKNVEADFMSAQ